MTSLVRSDVRFVSPATGGIDNKITDKDVTGLAVAVERAMSNYERLSKVVAVAGEVSVLNLAVNRELFVPCEL